jgi:hypothetical protein
MFQNPINYLANPKKSHFKLIRVVVAEPNRPAEVRMIRRTLDAMQAIVGGYIERVPWHEFDVFFNEEGRGMQLPPNRVVAGYPIIGTLFVSKTSEEGESVSLSEVEAGLIRAALDKTTPGSGGWQDPYIINPVRNVRREQTFTGQNGTFRVIPTHGGFLVQKRLEEDVWRTEAAFRTEEDALHVARREAEKPVHRIRVVVAEPNRPAEIRMIDYSYDGVQAIVGGPIELMMWGDLTVWYNEDSRDTWFPPNRVIAGQHVAGTLFVAYLDEMGEGAEGLSEAEANTVRVALDELVAAGRTGGWKDPYVINPVETIHPAALRAAYQDMRAAKKHGEISVAQTRVGTVDLSYERGVYRLVGVGSPGRQPHVIAEGSADVVHPALARLYDVIEQNPVANPLNDRRDYKFYVLLPTGIISGWSFESDARDSLAAGEMPEAERVQGPRIVSRASLVRMGLDPRNNMHWRNYGASLGYDRNPASLTGEQLFEQALARVESRSIREWATSPRNRPIWLRIAEATAARGGEDADPTRFSTYMVITAMGM